MVARDRIELSRAAQSFVDASRVDFDDGADSPQQWLARGGTERLPEHANLSALWACEAQEHPDGRRLPGAVWTKKRVDAAASHAQARVVDRAHIAKMAR